MKKIVHIVKTALIVVVCGMIYAVMPQSKMKNYIQMVMLFIVGAVFLYLIGKGLLRFLKKQIYLHSTIHRIDCMSGIEFENCLKAHFEKMGYSVKTTPKSGDYGVDLICKKGKERFVVQAKRYQGKIGISAVQQVIGGMHYYGCEKGMVITNSFFTKNACELAEKSNVVLWDRNTLQKKFHIREEHHGKN